MMEPLSPGQDGRTTAMLTLDQAQFTYGMAEAMLEQIRDPRIRAAATADELAEVDRCVAMAESICETIRRQTGIPPAPESS